jgi:C4-dicarboxylate-specific signal transduction histidine kinase
MFLRAGILIAVVSAAAILSTVPSLRWISMVVVIGASALLGWLSIRVARDTARKQLSSDELRPLNDTLEAQVEARTAELRDSNAQLSRGRQPAASAV